MEREAHEYIQPPLKDLKKEYEYLYKGYNKILPGPFSQLPLPSRKGISISEKRIFKQGGEVIVKHQPGHYLKSKRGNSGMFDMTNPNIYKILFPAAFAGTAAARYKRNKQ